MAGTWQKKFLKLGKNLQSLKKILMTGGLTKAKEKILEAHQSLGKNLWTSR